MMEGTFTDGSATDRTREATARHLQSTLTDWFGASVGVGYCAVADPGPLLPVEAAAMARATPARRAEFAAGRTAARRAMTALARQAVAIPMGPDRRAHWPEGLCGSITHDSGHALAIVGLSPDILGLGIDLTPDADLPPGVAEEIAFGAETDLPGAVVFAAKEATYKAVYPLSGATWPFQAVTISLTETGFGARLDRSGGPFQRGAVLQGNLSQSGGLILAAVCLRSPDI